MAGARALVASTDWAAARTDGLGILREWMDRGEMAFGSGASVAGPFAVRLAAARLVEEGADPARLLRALTSGAASILGDPARGRIAEGAVADLVLWSGDPTDLRSRPLRAWVAGEEVFHAP
jgi:imidazolonepropionase-like amidohydrolase